MSLINEIVQKSRKSKFPEPLTDQFGWKYYEQLPDGMRLATLEDVKNGGFKNNTPFLLKALTTGKYECHRIEGVFPERLKPFIEEGRVWLLG